jgi:UDP-2,3-diacylglucosamine pyrophosphatase LpxH
MRQRKESCRQDNAVISPFSLNSLETAGFPARARFQQAPGRHHRAIFLSDMHLGARMCRPDAILEFLNRNTADMIYLVGDIVDNWDPLSPHWTADHHRVLHRLLDFPSAGTRVVYIPGNHDAFFRQMAGTEFGGISIRQEITHEAADGRRYLVVHGDCCDHFARTAPVAARLGSFVEGIARGIDTVQRRITRAAGLGEWSGIEDAILWTNAMIRKYDRFQERLSALAATAGVDGVICGHFHEPALHNDFGPIYANCGDWSSNCTAIVEDQNGHLRLVSSHQAAVSSLIGDDLDDASGETEQTVAM